MSTGVNYIEKTFYLLPIIELDCHFISLFSPMQIAGFLRLNIYAITTRNIVCHQILEQQQS